MKSMYFSMIYLALISSNCFASDVLSIRRAIKRLATKWDFDLKDQMFALVYLKNEPDDYRWNFPPGSGLLIGDYKNEIHSTIKDGVIFSYLMPRNSKLERMPVLFINDETREHFYKRYLALIGSKIEHGVELQNDCPLYEMQESTKKFKLIFPIGCNVDTFMERNKRATLQFIVSGNKFYTRPALLAKDFSHAIEIIPKDERSYRLMDEIVEKKKQCSTRIRGNFLAIDLRDCFELNVECEASCNVRTELNSKLLQ